jgi:UDP-N-acetylglucosamine 2-epimerase (non-hydrolysing)
LVLVVGDVNSTLAAALVAKKLGIPVAHVEAGLRSGDRDMPEEINRLATDAIADYAFVTEYEALQHLAREGWNPRSVFFVGNTMIDSLSWAMPRVQQSGAAERLGLKAPYVVVTLHRPSNVDSHEQLAMLMGHIRQLAESRQVLFPMHPRTQAKARDFGISIDHPNMVIVPPMGYVDFVSAVRGADFIVTDSGGIQEETTWMGVPCLTLRTTTERPITVEVGTNVLVNPRSEEIGNAIANMLAGNRKSGEIPPYWDGHAARRIAAILPSLLGPGGVA